MALLLLVCSLTTAERLVFDVRYGPFHAGTLVLESKGPVTYEGEECRHLVSHLRSNPSFRFLFSIDDYLESYVRIRDSKPVYFSKRVRETGYYYQCSVVFDYARKRLQYSDGSAYPLLEGTVDLVSLWNYVRRQSLEPGRNFPVTCHADRRTYVFEMETSAGKWFETPLGPTPTLRLRPQGSVPAALGPRGNFEAYVSTDARHIPVVIKTDVLVGSVIATLKEVAPCSTR